MSLTIKSAFIALTLAACVAPSALAQTGAGEPSLRVAYGDLDMSQISAGEALLQRIANAAGRVCDDATSHSPLTPRAVSDCRRETVASVVRQLNIDTLTFAWNGTAATSTFASRD